MNLIFEIFILIFFVLCLVIFVWETVFKNWLKNRNRKSIDKILSKHSEVYIPRIDSSLRLSPFKGKYMLHINDGKAPILYLDDSGLAEEINNLWWKYVGKMNEEIEQLILEKHKLI